MHTTRLKTSFNMSTFALHDFVKALNKVLECLFFLLLIDSIPNTEEKRKPRQANENQVFHQR